MDRIAATLVAALVLAPWASADEHLVPDPNGPLAGKTVVVSPGHGYMLDGGAWRYQRGITQGIREDVHTNEIVIEHLARLLANAGARVESCRERTFNTNEVIVDDAQATLTGTWSQSTSNPDFHGAGYRAAQVAASATATAEFRPTIPAAGRYPVYAWFTTGANRARDARLLVNHSGGRSAVTLDQSTIGDHWVFVGDFHFEAGTTGSVVVTNQGSDPTKYVIADAVRFGGGVGRSGQPRWRESAQAFLAHKGFSSAAGDVTVRPLYATWLAGGDTTRWRSDFVYFALHTNASNGAATGLSTFSYSNGRTAAWDSAGPAHYPTSPSPLQTASDGLRDRVHAQVLGDIRATLNPAWGDRQTHRMNFGELREARNMPSTLIELGFHDAPGDADQLKSARFRAVAARAIYKALLRHFAGQGATVLPLAPDGLRLENTGPGQVRASWDLVRDPLESSAAPAQWRVYVSRNGRGFDDGVVVAGQSATIGGLTPGERVFVKVAALNAGGESLCSRTAGARVSPASATPRGVLLVDGFDRVYEHDEGNIAGRFTYDYAIEHLDALVRAAPAAGVDYASNEAVVRGSVRLAGYALVDWHLGREGSIDRTFDADEQRLLETYLGAGGTLLASGAEIGWDLQARGGGARFLNDVLGAAFASDDAGARAVRASPGSPLAVPAFALTAGPLADSCDALTATAQGALVLAYEAAGAPGAGVGRARRSLVLGFPLEAVPDGAARGALTTQAVSFLVPPFGTATAGGGTTPGGGVVNPGTGPVITPGTTPGSGGATQGGATAPVGTSSTGAAATAGPTQQVAAGGGGGGGGCSLASASGAAGSLPSVAVLALAVGLLALRRREVVASA